MSELQVIESVLEKAARRQRWQRAWRGLWKGLLVGAVLWLIALAAYKVFPIEMSVLQFAGIAAVVPVVLGFLIAWWHRPSIAETARWVDGRDHLKERLSTALELAAEPAKGNWQKLIIADAAKHAEKLDPRRLLPFSLPRVSRWALVVLAVSAGLGFVPEYRSKTFVQTQKEKENIRDTGKQLAELTRRSLQQRPPALETTQKTMEEVAELGDQFMKKNLTRGEALKDLANVADKLKDQLKEMGKEPAFRKMEQAARAAGNEASTTAEGLQKQIDQMKKDLGNQAGNPDAIDKLKKELDKIQEMAKGMADKDGAMGEADKEKLSQSLASLSKEAKNLGMQMPNIDQAIQELQAGQIGMMLKDLDAAVKDLDKMRELAKAMQQLQQKAEKMGKDLAEQLKNGQAQAAMANLQKMIEELKKSNLTKEQLQKLMEEVAKAADPGKQYGKVGECLAKAASKMGEGDKPGAGKSLDDAAKELAKLMDQMSDMQSLMAELETLQRAQLAVGTCQGMGQCERPGLGKGKGGQGVGTWADENSWLNEPQFTDLWDNSGLVRPDMDARGHTDRGDGQAPDNLAPTKVKGQFSPGGQMPSITLKGVSIKGSSSVQYTEAAAAAQTEAQSALSQEKVPRAYQGAVRDYFDDLKK
jgi:hypothetical protein